MISGPLFCCSVKHSALSLVPTHLATSKLHLELVKRAEEQVQTHTLSFLVEMGVKRGCIKQGATAEAFEIRTFAA